MGQFINQVKVKVDYDNGKDKNFIFTILAKNEADVLETVAEGLKQKIKEGELEKQNLRSYTVESDDKRGFFSSFVGDIADVIKQI